MKTKYDVKKEWPKIKSQLMQVSKEALALAKKGEEQLIHASQRGKLHVDSTALNLKREHLYHLIGKEYVRTKTLKAESAKMKKLLSDLSKMDRQAKELDRKIHPKRKKARITKKV